MLATDLDLDFLKLVYQSLWDPGTWAAQPLDVPALEKRLGLVLPEALRFALESTGLREANEFHLEEEPSLVHDEYLMIGQYQQANGEYVLALSDLGQENPPVLEGYGLTEDVAEYEPAMSLFEFLYVFWTANHAVHANAVADAYFDDEFLTRSGAIKIKTSQYEGVWVNLKRGFTWCEQTNFLGARSPETLQALLEETGQGELE